MSLPEKQAANSRAHSFNTTQWSVVLAAGDSDSPRYTSAMEVLCRKYWLPLYSYLRNSGNSPTDASDLTQGFFCQLIKKRIPARADSSRGKFRGFLLSALKQHLHSEHERSNRQKRGGGVEHLSLELEDAEQRHLAGRVQEFSPDEAYDRKWAELLFDEVMRLARTEYEEAGWIDRFDALKDSLMRSDDSLPYAELAPRLGVSEEGVKSAARRLRQRFRDLFRQRVASFVEDPREVEGEIRRLIFILSAEARSGEGGGT